MPFFLLSVTSLLIPKALTFAPYGAWKKEAAREE